MKSALCTCPNCAPAMLQSVHLLEEVRALGFHVTSESHRWAGPALRDADGIPCARMLRPGVKGLKDAVRAAKKLNRTRFAVDPTWVGVEGEA